MRKHRHKAGGFFAGVDPEEAFLDSSNLPGFDDSAMEGRIVRALSRREVFIIGALFTLLLSVFIYRLTVLQIVRGEYYAKLAENNSLTRQVLFAERGLITDRYGRELAWNEPQEVPEAPTDELAPLTIYSLRKYTKREGLAHLLGFINYPEADKQGNWWRETFEPKAGVELTFNDFLAGHNGHKLIEVDAHRRVLSAGALDPPVHGNTLRLSIDAELTEQLHKAIKHGSDSSGFKGGAGVIIDVHTGEILALTSYPEYDPNILTDGSNHDAIVQYSKSAGKPFLNRAVQGSYTPGSIVKPYIGAVALEEGIITEDTKILSTGVLRVPNPYNPGQYSTFKDWRKGLGLLDIRDAIKMSSSIFFYVVGGGFEEQRGLGIGKIASWAGEFGFGQLTGVQLPGEVPGLVPTPQWQKEVFGADAVWRLGNTYHAAIGQYGWLVTPIQAARYIASIGNLGKLYKPVLTVQSTEPQPVRTVNISRKNYEIIREGMRRGAKAGTAQALNIQGITIAAKTGTAQLGTHNEYMNSWVVGYWPFDYVQYGKPIAEPRFAFAVVLEKAPAGTLRGAAPAMRPFFQWLVEHHGDDYAIGKYPTNIKPERERASTTATTTQNQ